MKEHLIKVKEMYWSEKVKAPVFILEDGREFYPTYTPTGSCWMIIWDDKAKSNS